MSDRIRHCDIQVVNVQLTLQCSFRMLDGKLKYFKKKSAVMRSCLVLAINHADKAYANFHYTEYGMAKLPQESCKWNP